MSQFHPTHPHHELLWIASLLDTGAATPEQQRDFAARLARLAGTVLAKTIALDQIAENEREEADMAERGARLHGGEVVYATFRRPVLVPQTPPGAA